MLVETRPFSLIENELTPHPQEAATAPDDFGQRAHLLSGNVSVVTSNDDGEWFGMTSASVCALSSDPPTLVACLGRRSRLGRELGRTRRFCVNVLGPDQLGIAEAFTDPLAPAAEQFIDVSWRPGATGTPVLAQALAAFECEVDMIYGYPQDLFVVGSVRHVTSQWRAVQSPVAEVRRHLIAG